MWYLIYSQDVADSLAKRLAVRDKHLARLKALELDGRLLVAGPNPLADHGENNKAGFSGSTVIAKFANLDEATDWANADPYIQAGVYASVSVKPFINVLPL